MNQRIVAIETSCDETAIAVLAASGGLRNPRFKILKNLIASQVKIHRPFGGVVPNIAKREHIKTLPLLYRTISGAKEKEFWKSLDAIAVTVGPGLEPALWAGITFAKELSAKWHKPLIGVNHLEGHLYSFLLDEATKKRRLAYPGIALIVSGGHTILLRLDSLTTRAKLGETRDDAVGEAFDKVARLLKLPYPGGPEIEKRASKKKEKKRGGASLFLPRPMIAQKNYDFSFSGLKTAVLYHLRDHSSANSRSGTNKAEVAAAFQEAAIDVLVTKTMRAVDEFGAGFVALSGGVAANKSLRAALRKESAQRKLPLLVPDFVHNTDNAAMIAVAGYVAILRKKKYKLEARGDMNI